MSGGRQLLLFGIVGVIGFVVDVSTLLLARDWLGVYAARVLSFVVAATATWLLNRRLTFTVRRESMGLLREYVGYVGAMVAGAAVNYVIYSGLVWYLGHTPLRLVIYVAIGAVAGMCVNYLGASRMLDGSPKPGRA